MVYTCYDMIRDCRADKPEGWSYFIASYVPVIRKLLNRYAGNDSALDRILLEIRPPGSGLFDSIEPVPERWFLAELRCHVVSRLEEPAPAISLDLETVASALQPLTFAEKAAAWLDTMRYTPAEAGPMLRMAPATVGNIRTRAGELIRANVDSWRATLLSENGLVLGREAAARRTGECVPVKTFLDILDGRTSWFGRETIANHTGACWFCVDHYSRLVEVLGLLRETQPLGLDEITRFSALLGVETRKAPVWKRWLA